MYATMYGPGPNEMSIPNDMVLYFPSEIQTRCARGVLQFVDAGLSIFPAQHPLASSNHHLGC